MDILTPVNNSSNILCSNSTHYSCVLENGEKIQPTSRGNISELPGDYEGDYYYYYDNPYQMRTKEWQVPIFSYLYSGIALLTILVNLMVIYVFAFKRMRSQTTFLLSSLACTESVICFPVAIYHIYFHLLEHYKEPVKYKWCIVKHIIYIVEQMARSSSNWITALLGVQRFVCICFPFRARTLCSVKTSIIAVAFSIAIGISVYIYEAMSVQVISWPVMNGSSYLYEGCMLGTGDGVTQKSTMIHYIMAGIITRLLPCMILLITTVLLARKLQHRQRGIAADVQDGNKSSLQIKRLNVLVFIILVIFLFAELQDTVAFCIYVYELATDKVRKVLSQEADEYWDTWGSLLSLAGYHCNFWIFFLMSAQFRSAFYETCSSIRTVYSTTKSTYLSSEDIESSRPLQGEK